MAHDDTGTHVPSTAIDYIAIEESPAFVEHKRRHRSFVFPLTIAFLVWYFAYVLLTTYAPGFMSEKLVGNINVGLVAGLLQFVSTFLVTALYIRHADTSLDPVSARLREQFEAGRR